MRKIKFLILFLAISTFGFGKPIQYDTIRTVSYNRYTMRFGFKFDKFDIDLDYLNNNSAIANLDTLINSISSDDISQISIITQSSPEGVYEHNIWLSEQRSITIGKFIQDRYPMLSERILSTSERESWESLRNYVIIDTILSKQSIQKILDVIDSDVNIGTKKWRMEHTLGNDPNVGNIYNYLYRKYYKYLRYSRISVDYTSEEILIEEIDTVPVIEISYPDLICVIDSVVTDNIVENVEIRDFPKLAVKTNLLYDAFFTKYGYYPILNFELEYYLTENGHWSIVGEYEFPWWYNDSHYQYLQIMNLQLEGRYYLKDGMYHSGHYLSVYGGGGLYDICFDDDYGHGYQGEGFHIGVGYGYVLPLKNKWKLEFFVKAGYFRSKYDPYYAGNPFAGKYYYDWFESPNLFVSRNWRFRWFGPTGLGVNINYDLIKHRK